MPNFPASLDNGTSLPNPTGSSTQNNPDHASLHTSENAAIIAAETKLGTGASTPASNTLLVGTGAGTSAWQGLTSAQLAAILSDETGTGSAVFANTPVLITPKVDTINENTGGNGVTVGGVNLKSGAISTASSVPAAAIQAGAVGQTQVANGVIVQVANTVTSAFATGTTTIPYDNTIPQNTEGDQYMSLSITPKSATNTLLIVISTLLASSAANNLTIALFQDSNVNALAATAMNQPTTNGQTPIALAHSMAAGTTSATTFKVRGGGNGGGTYTFNGSNGTGLYGAATKSSIVIYEYKS